MIVWGWGEGLDCLGGNGEGRKDLGFTKFGDEFATGW